MSLPGDSVTGMPIAACGRMFDRIDALERRTQRFAIEAARYVGRLPRTPGVWKVADQLADSAGSVGANHRAMRRARSRREFAAKLQTVVEEVDESVYWLEVSTALCPEVEDGLRLLAEARELRAIFVRARATTRARGEPC